MYSRSIRRVPLVDMPASLCQVSTIEFSLVEVSVLHGLQQGNEVLKEIHKELNVENVERILEETQEAREYQRVRIFLKITPAIVSKV